MKKQRVSHSNGTVSAKAIPIRAIKTPKMHKTPMMNGSNGKSVAVVSQSRVNGQHERRTMNGHTPRNGAVANGPGQGQGQGQGAVANVLLFVAQYREKVRSPNKLDTLWLETGLCCLDGLDLGTKVAVYQTLINEAVTYNRLRLSRILKSNVHRMQAK